MQFYPIKSDNEDGTYAYLLSTLGNTLLFIGGLPYKSLLHYYPLNEDEGDQTQSGLDVITKKRKLTSSLSSTPSKKEHNNYYLISSTGQGFIKGPRIFNLSIINYINMSTVNSIFLSAVEDIAILPYLTRQKQFKAKVFCTTPVKQIGTYLLKELHSIVSLRNKQQVNIDCRKSDFFDESDFYDYFEENYGVQVSEWCEIFTKEEIEASIKLLNQVNYRQEWELNEDLSFTAYSAGYQIGSAYWVFKLCNQINFAVVPYVSLHSSRHALSFELHSDKIPPLKYLFVCNCFSKLHEVEIPQDLSFNYKHELYLFKFVDTIKKTLKEDPKMNIMIPVNNMLLLLDLFDILNNRLVERVKLIIISEAIESIVRYSNANIEYLVPLLQKKIMDANPEAPFSSYEKLKKTERLIHFSDLFEFQEKNKAYSIKQMIQTHTPCIYFICHATMRMGVGLRLLEQFEEAGTKTTVVLTDPFLQTAGVFPLIREKFTTLKSDKFSKENTSKRDEISKEKKDEIPKKNIVYSPLDVRATEQEFQDFLISKNLKVDSLIIPSGCSINLSSAKNVFYTEEEDLYLDIDKNLIFGENKFLIRSEEIRKKESNFRSLFMGCAIGSGIKGTKFKGENSKIFKISDMEEEFPEKAIRAIILPKNPDERCEYFKKMEEKITKAVAEELNYFEMKKSINQTLKLSYINKSREDTLSLKLDEKNSIILASNQNDLKHFTSIVQRLFDFVVI